MLALALIMTLLILLGAVYALSLVAVSSAQAARGADMAALAAADAARGLTQRDPCTVALALAERNGVELTSCTVTGPHGTEVVVRSAVPILPERLLNPSAVQLSDLVSRSSARAGPPPA
ncbi:hypothetical protein GCM10009672_24290 [Nesterenkonia lutea]